MSKYADVICLGVGLYSGDDAAQRLYIKCSYHPDGSVGMVSRLAIRPYATCCNNDNLALYLSKKLELVSEHWHNSG